ncbi:MAG: dephospho-CoA kinase, partial [Aquificae bacterium]|nr:dephospho-CoA kinase [Aquificota bacterium]
VVVVVYAPESLQKKRLIEKGLTEEEAEKRIKAQMPSQEKVKYGDFVINNTEDLLHLEREVKKLYSKLVEAGRNLKKDSQSIK